MKKLFFILLGYLILGLFSQTHAQPAASYSFAATNETYTEITGGTIMTSPELSLQNYTWNNSLTARKNYIGDLGFAIGFDFKYNGTIMNKFAIDPYGFIYLGKDSVFSGGGGANSFTVNNPGTHNIVGSRWSTQVFSLSQTEISYKLSGTSPQRELVVQYKKLGIWKGFEAYDTINVQIILMESGNKVKIVFGNCQTTNTGTQAVFLGIKGTDDTDFHYRTGSWASSTPAMANNEVLYVSNSNFPALGLTYVFTPSSPCTTPLVQPTNLSLKTTSTQINGSFKKTANLLNYLVVMNNSATLSANPTDGVRYSPNQMIGDGKVLYFGNDSNFVASALNSSTTYHFHVFATHYLCDGDIKYNTTTPLKSSIMTMPAAPSSLNITKVNFDSIVFSVTAAGHNVLVAFTDKPNYNSSNQIIEGGTFGEPLGNYTVGDSIIGGGIVIYKGGSASNIVIKGLQSNWIYHLQAWSIAPDGSNYSSLTTFLDTITSAKIPYLQALIFANSGVPMGWESQGPKTFSKSTNTLVFTNMGAIPYVATGFVANGPQVNNYTSPWIKMSENFENRLIFSYNLYFYSFGNKPYNTWTKDSLLFQYSLNGTDYTTFYVINAANKDSMNDQVWMASRRIPIPNVKGKTAKIRISWLMDGGTPSLRVAPIVIEEIRPCDYPLNVTVVDSTILGSNALIKWNSQGSEILWNIRSRITNSENWKIEQVNSNPYLMNEIPSNSLIDVQVQAKCSQESLSLWTPTLNFESNYSVPFLQNFDASSGTSLPKFWTQNSGIVKDTITFTSGSAWRTGNWRNITNVGKSAYLGLTASNRYSWIIVPAVDLGNTNTNYQLEFDAAITAGGGSSTKPNSIDKSIYLEIYISTNAGKTWLKKDRLLRVDSINNAFLNIGDSTHYIVDLSAYRGKVQLGFLVYGNGQTEQSQVHLDNIGISLTCSPATISASKIVSDSAIVNWTSGASNFVYKFNGGGLQATSGKTLVFTGLTPQTEYTFALAAVCKAKDTSAWKTLSFTTTALGPCNLPTAMSVSEITKISAKVSWTGAAKSYKIRFKSQASSSWITQNSSTNSVVLLALSLNTTYEYQIQSVCSNASGDTSNWTSTATFKTNDITCNTPTSLIVTNILHNSVKLEWASTAAKFEINYRIGSSSPWQSLTTTVNNLQLSGLTPTTEYNARVRAICATGDTSEWTTALVFSTVQIPPCVTPSNLRSENITKNSVDILWDSHASNLFWLLRYRISTATVWDSVKNLSTAEYTLTNLIANTAYTWTVQANCDEGRTSSWGNQAQFTTQEDVNTENISASMLEIYSSNGQIHLLNKGELNIQKIEILNIIGQTIDSYSINSSDHIILTTNLKNTNIIVRVLGNNLVKTYKLLIP